MRVVFGKNHFVMIEVLYWRKYFGVCSFQSFKFDFFPVLIWMD